MRLGSEIIEIFTVPFSRFVDSEQFFTDFWWYVHESPSQSPVFMFSFNSNLKLTT